MDEVAGAGEESGLLHPAGFARDGGGPRAALPNGQVSGRVAGVRLWVRGQHVHGSGGPRVTLLPVQILGADCVDHESPLRESVVVGAAEVKGGVLAGNIRVGTSSRMTCIWGGGTLPPPPVSGAQARSPGVQGCPLLPGPVYSSPAALPQEVQRWLRREWEVVGRLFSLLGQTVWNACHHRKGLW